MILTLLTLTFPGSSPHQTQPGPPPPLSLRWITYKWGARSFLQTQWRCFWPFYYCSYQRLRLFTCSVLMFVPRLFKGPKFCFVLLLWICVVFINDIVLCFIIMILLKDYNVCKEADVAFSFLPFTVQNEVSHIDLCNCCLYLFSFIKEHWPDFSVMFSNIFFQFYLNWIDSCQIQNASKHFCC